MDFLILFARWYIGLGMIVVMWAWFWHWMENCKQKALLGANFTPEPFGLDRYLWIWIWWPGFLEKVIRNYLEGKKGK